MVEMSANRSKVSSNPWTDTDHQGHVSIGPHSLFLRASGLPRTSPSTPAIIIEAGLGGTSSEWVAVCRVVSKFARVYSYDRAGYGQSKPFPESARPLTSKKRCEELTELLKRAGIEPPWIVMGHSYGGALVREFLLMHGEEKVVGMIIVDSAITRTKLPDEWPTLLGDASYMDVVGLEKSRVLSDEEWAQLKRDDQGNEAAVEEEDKCQVSSTTSINERVRNGGMLLGNGRLSVVFCDSSVDFGKILEWGVEHGNGTEQTRTALRTSLEDMREIEEEGQRAHLTLSSRSRFAFAEGVARTHNVQLVSPDFIAQEVKWVLEGVQSLRLS